MNAKKIILKGIVTIVPSVLIFVLLTSIDIWVSHGAGTVYTEMTKAVLNKTITITQLLTFGWAIIVLIFYVIIYLVSEMKRLDEINKGSANELYQHFSELSAYKKREVILEIMKGFAEKNEYVHAVQMYSYKCKMNDKYNIKVNLVNSYVEEDININGISQEYYNIPNELYKDFMEVIKEVNKFEITKTVGFITKYHAELVNKQDFDETDAIKYSLIQFAIELRFSMQSEPRNIVNILPPDTVKKLANMRRLGIMCGILKKSFNVFKHEEGNGKSGRIYVTRCITFENSHYIALLTISPNIINESDWRNKIQSLVEQFVEELQKHFVVSYNESREG